MIFLTSSEHKKPHLKRPFWVLQISFAVMPLAEWENGKSLDKCGTILCRHGLNIGPLHVSMIYRYDKLQLAQKSNVPAEKTHKLETTSKVLHSGSNQFEPLELTSAFIFKAFIPLWSHIVTLLHCTQPLCMNLARSHC